MGVRPWPLVEARRARVTVGLRERFALPGAPRAYWYVWWGTLVNRLGGFVIPLLTIYLTKQREQSVADAGGIVAVFGLGQVAASIVGGEMSDRLGRRVTMVISLFGGAIAMAALGIVRDLVAITATVGIVGFVGELYRPAVMAFVADVIPADHRRRAYGLLHWVINVGFAFAAVIGGVLADLDFTILFIADAATMAVYGVIVLVAVPETRPTRPRDDAPGSTTAPSRSWIRDREFVVFCAISFALTLLPLQAGAALSAHMSWQGFSTSAYGLVMAINGVLIIALQPVLTAWCARFDASRLLAGAALLYGAGIAMHGLAPTLAVHAGAVTVWTFAEIFETPTRSSLGAAMAPADARGRYQGALTTAWGAAFFLGPKLGTWIWDELGATTLWLGCLGLGAAVALAIAATAPALRRRMTEQPTE